MPFSINKNTMFTLKEIQEYFDREAYIMLYSQIKELNQMPGIVNIAKGAKAHVLTRAQVEPGQVFAMRERSGKLGKNYAHIGSNGLMYSVNTATGELASSDNEQREVVLTGAFKYKVNRNPAPNVVRACRRSEVRSGEVFHVNGMDTLYAHMGRIERALNGYLSVPLARTENHAVTRNGNSNVRVIGTFTLEVTPVA